MEPEWTGEETIEPGSPTQLRRARLLAEASARHGAALPHAAVRFPLRAPGVACVVAGFTSPEEVVSDARWAAADLTAEAWRDLDTAAESGAGERA